MVLTHAKKAGAFFRPRPRQRYLSRLFSIRLSVSFLPLGIGIFCASRTDFLRDSRIAWSAVLGVSTCVTSLGSNLVPTGGRSPGGILNGEAFTPQAASAEQETIIRRSVTREKGLQCRA